MLYLIVDGTEVKGLTTKSEISNIESPITEEQYEKLSGFLSYESDALQLNLVEVVEAAKIIFEHNIPDNNPENGIPEIDGDGIAAATITTKILSGNTYSLTSIGAGEWDYERIKISDGEVIIDNTYEGKKLNLTTDKGMLNKTEIVLDSESKGTFRIRSEARTCVNDEAARIEIYAKDIEDCIGNTLLLEFGPVDF